MKTPLALATLREAVRLGSVATFLYDGLQMEADLYLLGQARKTQAYIVLAWCKVPALGWMSLRFALIKNFEVIGKIDTIRPDYDPRASFILCIDTRLPEVGRHH